MFWKKKLCLKYRAMAARHEDVILKLNRGSGRQYNILWPKTHLHHGLDCHHNLSRDWKLSDYSQTWKYFTLLALAWPTLMLPPVLKIKSKWVHKCILKKGSNNVFLYFSHFLYTLSDSIIDNTSFEHCWLIAAFTAVVNRCTTMQNSLHRRLI